VSLLTDVVSFRFLGVNAVQKCPRSESLFWAGLRELLRRS
jgi:hypothetical protein